jgi:hypothetical protein
MCDLFRDFLGMVSLSGRISVCFSLALKCSEASGWEEASINDSIGSSDINVGFAGF